MPSFLNKSDARTWVWDTLRDQKIAAFPFPPHHRIPNFRGAADAARRLLADPLFEGVRRIKVNPDAPQRHVRKAALEAGVVVYMPSPRLKSGFIELDPARIPQDKLTKAASMSHAADWGRELHVWELPETDLVVTGCVAVTATGRRCGKGHGFSDIEYAVLRELGHPPVPVVTTVHDLQVVHGFPTDPHDLTLRRIFTPTQTLDVTEPGTEPVGIDWAALAPESLEEMPVLGELARWRTRLGTTRFWETTQLEDMSREQWEALCDGCGRCCLLKLRDSDTGEVAYTDVACKLLDTGTCRCSDYAGRSEIVPDCVVLDVSGWQYFSIMPSTCGYRRVWEGLPLPPWHPLETGTPSSTHHAGFSVRFRVISERDVHEDELVDRLVDWISLDSDG